MKDSWLNDEVKNPLSDLISDETYNLLRNRGLINEKSIRDYIIRKKFNTLRESNLKVVDAIEKLREEYPYLQFDTLRKIVYRIG